MTIIILAGTTSASTSTQFCVIKTVSKTISADGLAGAEYADLQIKHGSTWVSTGVANRLTATNPVLSISSEGDYRLVKSVTVAAVSLAVSS